MVLGVIYVHDMCRLQGHSSKQDMNHSATGISVRPGLTEVLLFGGIPET